MNELPNYTAEISVVKAKNAVNNVEVKTDLNYIVDNFYCFLQTLSEMRVPGQSLWTSYNQFNKVLEHMDSLKDPQYADKLRELLTTNKNMDEILEIVLVLSEIMNNYNLTVTTSRGHTQEELKALSFIPLVSCGPDTCSGLFQKE